MIRRKAEQKITEKPQMYGGNGTVQLRSLLNGAEEMNGKGRLFSVLTVQPGESIGFHVHEDEDETFYVVRGEGEFDDNGTKTVLKPGDVLFTAAGTGHAVVNTSPDEVLEFVGLILYK